MSPGQLASSLSTEGSGGSTYNQVSQAFDKIMYVLAFSTLFCRIKNQNIESEIQKLMVETLGPLQGRQEVFKDGATK